MNTRRSTVVVAVSMCLTGHISAQAPQISVTDLPSFDVASIKQNYGTGVSMADLARNLAGPTDRMVVDKTGLTGPWDFDLRFVLPDQPAPNIPGLPPPPTDAPSLLTAVQEQLGLRLEPQRAPVEVLVIASIERPTED